MDLKAKAGGQRTSQEVKIGKGERQHRKRGELFRGLQELKDKKKRGWQRMQWLDSISDSLDMNLSKLLETVKNRGAWRAAVLGVEKSHTA